MRRPVMEREVLEHSYVHYPYEAWCEYCVMHKARQDAHHDEHHETAAHSVISFDFGYCSRQPDGSDKITVLFARDRATGLIHALPTPAKGGRYMSYLTTELTRFIAWTGHQRVGLRCDNEPATLGLLDSVRRACRQLCISTIAEPVAPGNHQGNGAAERAVQSVRNQAGIFVSQLERLEVRQKGKLHSSAPTQFTTGQFHMQHGLTIITELRMAGLLMKRPRPRIANTLAASLALGR